MKSSSKFPMNHLARLGDGKEISATTGVVPILVELDKGKLQVIGTGFYITRYGLLLTARHVMTALSQEPIGDIRINVGDKLSDIAKIVLGSETPIGVTGPDGALVGCVTRATVMEALFPEKEA